MDKKQKIIGKIAQIGPKISKVLPKHIRNILKRRMRYAEYRSEQLRQEIEEQFGWPIPEESDYNSPYNVCLGILKDRNYSYAYNVAACRELKVPYKVIDLLSCDCWDKIKKLECDAFLASPDILLDFWHRIYEERLWSVRMYLEKIIYPSFEELYLWESKRRMHDWLVAHNVPHPRTWVFFKQDEALTFCKSAQYPLVFKMNAGAASNGIIILYNRKDAQKLVKKVFSSGIIPKSSDWRNREWGSVFLQEYIPHQYEWRIVRVGDSFFCRRKTRVGNFASGSGKIFWAKPLPGLLDFAREITELDQFRCMSLDFFENPFDDKKMPFLVNELQPIVGFREVPETEYMGRWFYEKKEWRFIHGKFHNNLLANLRVKDLLNMLKL